MPPTSLLLLIFLISCICTLLLNLFAPVLTSFFLKPHSTSARQKATLLFSHVGPQRQTSTNTIKSSPQNTSLQLKTSPIPVWMSVLGIFTRDTRKALFFLGIFFTVACELTGIIGDSVFSCCVSCYTRGIEAPIHYQTRSYNPISCYGNSVERTNEVAYRIWPHAWSYDWVW